MDLFSGFSWIVLAFGVSGVAWAFHLARLPSFLTVLFLAVGLGTSGISKDVPSAFTQQSVELALALLFLFVGQEATHTTMNRRVMTFAWHSSWPPFLMGGAVVFFWFQSPSLASYWVIGSAFALSALPILSLWLDQFRVPLHDRAIALQSVAWTDVIAWCGLALFLDAPRLPWLVVLASLGVMGLWFLRKQTSSLFLLYYVGWFFVCEAFHVHGLFWALLAAACWKRWSTSPVKWDVLRPWITWCCIPLVLVAGLSKLPSFQAVWTPSVVFAFMVLPMASRILAVQWAQRRVNLLTSPYPWSVLLNARGLTEIVFLSTAYQGHLLSSTVYAALVFMAVMGTVLPFAWQFRRAPSSQKFKTE